VKELAEIFGLVYNPTLDGFFSVIEKRFGQKTLYLNITVGYLLLSKSERVTIYIIVHFVRYFLRIKIIKFTFDIVLHR